MVFKFLGCLMKGKNNYKVFFLLTSLKTLNPKDCSGSCFRISVLAFFAIICQFPVCM